MLHSGLIVSFKQLLDKATSNLHWDWETIIQICDAIRNGGITPKAALLQIQDKITDPNPQVASLGLLVLESCVKRCGALIHDEIGTKQYMEQLKKLVKTTMDENVKRKTLELIQAWAFQFGNSPKYTAVKDTMSILKAEGYVFPQLKESGDMFIGDTASEWDDGVVCHGCRVSFGKVLRKHHCRACGQVFCVQCWSKILALPQFRIVTELKVCDACYSSSTASNRATIGSDSFPIKKPSDSKSNSTLLPTKTAIFTNEERGTLVSDIRDMAIKEIKVGMMNTMKETLCNFRKEMAREFSEIKTSISTLKSTIDDQNRKHVDEMNAIDSRIEKMESTTNRKIDDVSLNISKDLEKLKLQASDLPLQDTNNVPSTSIMNQCLNELDDNLSCKQNVVVFGIPEPHGGNDEEKAQNDQEQVRQIFKEVSFDESMDNIQCQRLGSYSPQLAQPRPLRVFLSSSDKVFLLIESAHRKRKSSTASTILKNTLILPD